MTSNGNQWVISWLVIDYWRWSMSNRWVIETQKFCGLSITHRWHRLLIDVIDNSAMTHRLLINCYTAHERHFSCFLVPFLFVCDSFIFVRRIFPCIWSSCWRCREAKCWSQLQMILNCAICNTEPPWRGNCQGVVQQKRQKDTGEPKFRGKWFATDLVISQ